MNDHSVCVCVCWSISVRVSVCGLSVLLLQFKLRLSLIKNLRSVPKVTVVEAPPTRGLKGAGHFELNQSCSSSPTIISTSVFRLSRRLIQDQTKAL